MRRDAGHTGSQRPYRQSIRRSPIDCAASAIKAGGARNPAGWWPIHEPPPHQPMSWTRNRRRRVPLLAGWSSLIAAVLLLASLFNAAVTNHTNEATNRTGSPATAALADGDDVRAGSLAGSPVVNCAKQPDYAGQSSWVPLYSRCTDALP